MKKIGFILILLAVSLIFLVSKTNSKLKPYYSGDAVNFRDKVIFASVNSGRLELFKLENNLIYKTLEIKNTDPIFNINEDFNDLKLSVENGQLYVYAVSRYTLYKYNVSNLVSAQLEKKSTNTYWEFYQRVDRLGENIATASEKGVKIFNNDLEVINAYDFKVASPYSIRSNGSEQYIFSIDKSKIKVYDRMSRLVVREIPLDFVYENNNHKAYYDILRNEIFAIDDVYMKKFDFNGNLISSFKHLDQPGYEVDSSYDNSYLYFSNGIGVVKMTKDNFKVLNSTNTNTFGGSGSWAMGLKVVNTDNGDVLVVFNGSSIVLLDNNLNKIDLVKSSLESNAVTATENLFLNLNRNWTTLDNSVIVSGGGFWPQETLKITFGNLSSTFQADNVGRFSQAINTPNLSAGYHDIKVTGSNSNLTYSISILVK